MDSGGGGGGGLVVLYDLWTSHLGTTIINDRTKLATGLETLQVRRRQNSLYPGRGQVASRINVGTQASRPG